MKLTRQQISLLNLLQDGIRHSVVDIANKCFIGDPRSSIRDLRNNGIDVKDEWVKSSNGGRYKRYWIERGGQK